MTDTPAPTPVVGRPGQAYEAAKLRWATIADAPRLTELWRAAYPDDPPDVRDMAAWLEHGGALMLHDGGGRPLAALRWRDEGDGWRVDRVATRPEQRGQGYGRWLATKVEALAIRRNVARLLLTLPRADPEQVAYYRRMGYRLVDDEHHHAPAAFAGRRASAMAEARDAPEGTAAPAAAGVTLVKVVGGTWQTKAPARSAFGQRTAGPA